MHNMLCVTDGCVREIINFFRGVGGGGVDDQVSRGVKNFNTVNFLYTINVINVELT